MATLIQSKATLAAAIADAQAVYGFVVAAAPGPHVDAGIEAAFLRLFRSWEVFLEDVCIGIMVGYPRTDGTTINCVVSFPSEAVAYDVLLQDRPYLEWGLPRDIQNRLKALFPEPCEYFSALRGTAGDLAHMRTIRNAIAHSSRAAYQRFEVMLGTRYRPGMRPADHLRSRRRRGRQTNFEHYCAVLAASATVAVG